MRVSPGPEETYVVDSTGSIIDPSKEAGNLATVATNTDKLDVNLSTVAKDSTLTGGTMVTKVKDSGGTTIDPATSTKQTDGSQKTQIVGSGSAVTATTSGGRQGLDVNIVSTGGGQFNVLDQTAVDTLNGHTFTTNYSYGLSTAGTEYKIMLLKVPGSPNLEKMYVYRVVFDIYTKGMQAQFKMYHTPTLTADGTTLTPINRYIGGGFPAAHIGAYYLPSATANGTLVNTWSVGKDSNSLIVDVGYTLVAAPGSNLLITAQGSNNNTGVTATIVWMEKE